LDTVEPISEVEDEVVASSLTNGPVHADPTRNSRLRYRELGDGA
jgi:hypothetical protein